MVCDHCGIQFEKYQNVKILSSRPRHFCCFEHHHTEMKSGGSSRKASQKTCEDKYGVTCVLQRPDVMTLILQKGHTPEAEKKRRATVNKNMKEVSIQLRRGLVLCRSNAEIAFLTKLAAELGTELVYQKYVNGWWIDAYSPAHDCWIQFDGVYWHSRPGHAERDAAQNLWFSKEGKNLVRVTDVEARASTAVIDCADRIRKLPDRTHPSL